MSDDKVLAAIGAIGSQLQGLERRFDGLQGEFGQMQSQFGGLDARFDRLERRFEEKADELHRHFDVVTESLRADLRLVAEGMISLSERHDRFEVAVHDEFVATRALLEPPTRAIGRRVNRLEDDVDDLKTRVKRLESNSS